MSQNAPDGFDPNDPFGAWRSVRDANLDAWAKSLTSYVGTDTFAKAIGMQLDTLLAASAPMRQAVQQYTEAYLAQANMPSRAEVVSLASRLTNIELRLDDMQAQLDAILQAVRAIPAPAPQLAAPATQPAVPAPSPEPAAPVAPRRTRKAVPATQPAVPAPSSEPAAPVAPRRRTRKAAE